MKTVIGIAALISAASLSAGGAPRSPNIIFMLADDLGYGDLSCYNPDAEGNAPNNTPIRTPNINRLAEEGVRLTDFHSAAPICSPSRRALLTARYPSRLGEWAEAYREHPQGVVAETDPTIGMWLKQAGYVTACYGKWNIGEKAGVSNPSAHGFDDWLVIDHNTGYFQHQNDNAECQGREMLFGPEGRVTSLRGKYLTDIWTDKAVGFIGANRNKPFFLYLPFAVPHSPLQDPDDPSLGYKDGPKPGTPEGRRAYVKMVEYLDSRIGKIFQALEKQGLMDNTLIIFTSDNGGMVSGNCWPLKKSKQWLEEGGIRVPFLMRWPGKIPSGQVVDQPSIMMDASVTVLAAADAVQFVPPDRELDGINLLPVLNGNAVAGRTFGWRRRDWDERAHNRMNFLRQEAFRSGDWKLLRSYKYLGNQTWSSEYNDELFNLEDDIPETRNLASAMPEKYEAMKAALAAWKQDVVDLEPDYVIPVRDQLGSPENLPEEPEADQSLLFDFADGHLNGGRVVTKNNESRVSGPEIENGILKMRLAPGMEHPVPLIYREGTVDTAAYSKLRVRMKVSSEGGCKPAKALLRSDTWQGQDIAFPVHPDGNWHEYVINASESPAWAQWTKSGRIGLVFPVPDSTAITVEVDFIKLAP
jgi:arylsulfatase A